MQDLKSKTSIPAKRVKMDTFPLCLSKVGPSVAPSAVSLPLTATDIGAFAICAINYSSGLFSKSRNLLLSHRPLKGKKLTPSFSCIIFLIKKELRNLSAYVTLRFLKLSPIELRLLSSPFAFVPFHTSETQESLIFYH